MSDETAVPIWEAYCFNREHEGGHYCHQCVRASATREKTIIYRRMIVQSGTAFLIRNVHTTTQHPQIGFISYEGIRNRVFVSCFDADPVWYMADWNFNDTEQHGQSALKTMPIEQDPDHIGEIQSLKYLQPYSGVNEIQHFERIGPGLYQMKRDEKRLAEQRFRLMSEERSTTDNDEHLNPEEHENLAHYFHSVALSYAQETPTDVPVLDEYCWHGEPHEGGWCCRQCWEQQQQQA